MHDSVERPDFIHEFRNYASQVRRDRRLHGSHVRTITLVSQAESKDSVTIDAVIRDGVIQDIGYRVRACSLAQATTAIVAERAIGMDIEALSAVEQQLELILQGAPPEVTSLIWPEILMLQHAAGMPSRHDIALLPFHALEKLLDTERQASASEA